MDGQVGEIENGIVMRCHYFELSFLFQCIGYDLKSIININGGI